jgi:hypothetical protein
VASSNPIRVNYREKVKYKLISEQPCLITVLSQFTNDSSHNVRAWYLPWMHSSSNYNTLFLWVESLRLATIREKILVLIFLIFSHHLLF